MKILWNLTVPYTTVARISSPERSDARGTSLMPLIEIGLLAVAVALFIPGTHHWPWTPTGIAAVGGAVVVGSYVHLAVVGGVVGWIASRWRHRG
jgi:Flp pilus assembly pilin Flp